MAGEYIVKCIKTGKRVGRFLRIGYGGSNCGNCGREIMWEYVFEDADTPVHQVILGSECAKNVPKFSEYYAKFKLFKDKVDLLSKLEGKKKRDLLMDIKFLDLAIIEAKIKAIKDKREQEQQARLDTQKGFAERLKGFAGHNQFLDSLYEQLINQRRLLSEKQIEVGTRVMNDIEPKVAEKIGQEKVASEHSDKVRQFIASHDVQHDWDGKFTGYWFHNAISMDRITGEIMRDFYVQVVIQQKPLSERQLELIAKAEHRYRGQIAHKQHRIMGVFADDCKECRIMQNNLKNLAELKQEVA